MHEGTPHSPQFVFTSAAYISRGFFISDIPFAPGKNSFKTLFCESRKHRKTPFDRLRENGNHD